MSDKEKVEKVEAKERTVKAGPKSAGAKDRPPRAKAPRDDEDYDEDDNGSDSRDLKRNADGSITIANTEEPVRKKIVKLVGLGVKPDTRYSNAILGKFVNCIMRDGKKSTAEKIVYSCLEEIANKLKVDPVNVFEQAINNAMPLVEVKSKRVGGANYQVPVEINPKRQHTLAVRWILEAVRGRSGMPTHLKLAQEIMDCYNKTGSTIQKRENTHRMAEANKAFSHFA